MNNEIKQMWLKALRSGKYQQTKHVLKSDSGMCCLGVLCDLYMQDVEKGEWEERSTSIKDSFAFQKHKTISKFGNCEVVPPIEVVSWAGLSGENPSTGIGNIDDSEPFSDNKHETFSLAELNDSGLTFNQIADVIQFAL